MITSFAPWFPTSRKSQGVFNSRNQLRVMGGCDGLMVLRHHTLHSL